MSEFRKILISGSNASVHAITASGIELNSNTSNGVVVIDNSTGILYYTGSYENAGSNPTFPGYYEGDIDLTVAAASSVARQVIIGKDRTTSGAASIDFIVDTGNTLGLKIIRDAGSTGDSNIIHYGTGDLQVSLTDGEASGGNVNQFKISRVDGGSYVDLFRVASSGNIFMDQLTNVTGGVGLTFNLSTKQVSLYSSTKRVKKDIEPLNRELVTKFNKLNPVTFRYTNDPKLLCGGFIAEEVAEIDPLLAYYGPNYKVSEGTLLTNEDPIDDTSVPYTVSDRALLALIVAKIQELDAKINELTKLKSDGPV